MKRIFLLSFCLMLGFTFLSAKDSEYKIVIVKKEFKLYLYQGTNLVTNYSVAIGKNPGDKKKFGDYRTPEGNFYITEIQDSHTWEHDFHDGKGPIKGAYGPWFFRLYTGKDRTNSHKKWTGIAIHGTHNPASICTMASEGCIRLHNQDDIALKALVSVGTPVIIEP